MCVVLSIVCVFVRAVVFVSFDFCVYNIEGHKIDVNCLISFHQKFHLIINQKNMLIFDAFSLVLFYFFFFRVCGAVRAD